ncbi:(deoxy)nucleoside triphosphate pyrophosphohydrolase [Alloscardovia sp. HMSC034E08]|uniref:(deoxy)nucleoside triphosphate pyrophosphohydrolase n=1 Tax=Alloscardovia sp. HMSC034E08 TaxID=1739413 RepID=UPI0008B3BFC4|nr:(deoxy)nucleoside triphosphate pyrophosphohydrolase [Alloscardovia sp. HMSC034E08]OFQ98069.1 DNA mismatch repair protein MutT [Alloscardovia sp. HMSC034E08]
MTKKIIPVVAAAIEKDGLIFCAQRGKGKDLEGYWEFPGGKIEQGETPEAALEREIREEFGAHIEVLSYVNEATYDYSFGTVVMKTYRAHLVSGELKLLEHMDSRWLKPADLKTLQWAPAYREAVEILRQENIV